MNRLALAMIGVLGITACTPLGSSARSVTLGQGNVIATPPAGYCVDSVSSQPARDFAVLAPCATLGGRGAAPSIVGVATVQVGPADSGAAVVDEIALRDFLITSEGASLLSQSGSAEAIKIVSSQAFNSQVMIYFTDEGPPPLAGLQREEWRAFTNVNGRLVTIGVRGLAAAPLKEGSGATLLKRMVAGVAPADP